MGVNLTSVLVTNMMSLALLIVTVVGTRWRLQTRSRQATCLRVIAVLILISNVVDPLVFWADGKAGVVYYAIVFAGNTWLYLANLILGPCWVIFVCSYLHQHISRMLVIALAVLNTVGFGLIICNAFAPVLFSVDSNSVYTRGPAYWAAAASVAIYFLCTIVPCLQERHNKMTAQTFPLWALFLPVILGTAAQSIVYGVSLVWPSICVSFAGVMLCLQDDMLSRDNLSGLYNRSTFQILARKMIDEHPEYTYAVVVSDIQNFKGINERYGIATGDKLLRYMGEYLHAQNDADSLYARYSSDQFVGIVHVPASVVNKHGLNAEAEQVMLQAMEAVYKDAPVPEFRVKFGVYADVDKTLSVGAMCDRARMALQEIKGQYDVAMGYYTDAMGEHLARVQTVSDQMEAALEQGQFKVYYQPKHSAQTREVVGAEALVRWVHPEYGLMAPNEFLNEFELNGFISKVDLHVWQTVCSDLATWIQTGHKAIPVSVNTSRKDYFAEDMLSNMLKGIENCGLDVSLLHVEVTESAYVDHPEALALCLSEIQREGLKVELDDFGSGYSSLGYLSRMPLDYVKLDMAFMREFEQQRTVVQTFIALSHELGLQVVAEGVETAEQLEALRAMGCDIIQGYYYSKPLPRADFEAYLISQGL